MSLALAPFVYAHTSSLFLKIVPSAWKDMVAKRKTERTFEHYKTQDPLAGPFSHVQPILTYSNSIILSHLSLLPLALSVKFI